MSLLFLDRLFGFVVRWPELNVLETRVNKKALFRKRNSTYVSPCISQSNFSVSKH